MKEVEWSKVEHVYVDLDGVLVDFIGGVNTLMGGGDRMPELDGALHRYWGMGEDEFWSRIDAAGAAFWANLQPYFWTEKVMSSLVRHFRPDGVSICTSPTWHGSSAAGKIDWMNRHLAPVYGRQVFRHFLITPQKHLLAGPNTLLIDDRFEPVESFRARGGQAILFPQPWNQGQAEDRANCIADLCSARTVRR